MDRNLSKEDFNKWREGWMREKGCPFFTCAQAISRKVCGKSHICGCLYDYNMYKDGKWIKECDVKLTEDHTGKLPTKICSACTSSMCIKINYETGQHIGQSPCKLMNDYYANTMKLKVDRSLEKYILSWGAYLVPSIGEEAYLNLQKDPDHYKKLADRLKK